MFFALSPPLSPSRLAPGQGIIGSPWETLLADIVAKPLFVRTIAHYAA